MEQNWELIVGQASEKIVPAPAPPSQCQCSVDSLPAWLERSHSQTDTSWTRFENIETVDVRIHNLKILNKKLLKQI